jgi:hypothetical protein
MKLNNNLSRALKTNHPKFPTTISIQTWERHFKGLLKVRQNDAIFPLTISETADSTVVDFSVEEVQDVIGKLKTRNQPDGPYSEH